MPCKTRAEQYRKFTEMRLDLEMFLIGKGWLWRQGEAARPREWAEILAKKGLGKLDSLHIYGLAADYWLMRPDGLAPIFTYDPRYDEMADFWTGLGGWAGRDRKKKLNSGKWVRDPDYVHFDLGEKPLKK